MGVFRGGFGGTWRFERDHIIQVPCKAGAKSEGRVILEFRDRNHWPWRWG